MWFHQKSKLWLPGDCQGYKPLSPEESVTKKWKTNIYVTELRSTELLRPFNACFYCNHKNNNTKCKAALFRCSFQNMNVSECSSRSYSWLLKQRLKFFKKGSIFQCTVSAFQPNIIHVFAYGLMVNHMSENKMTCSHQTSLWNRCELIKENNWLANRRKTCSRCSIICNCSKPLEKESWQIRTDILRNEIQPSSPLVTCMHLRETNTPCVPVSTYSGFLEGYVPAY